MLKIASYSLRGQVVRVKLKCSCGNSRIFEVREDDTLIYFCSKCRSRKILDELKKDASSYWKSRSWILECEPDQRAQPRARTDFPVEVTIRASRYSPAYCVLHGRCGMLSETGMMIMVEDFSESYFQDITSAYRSAEATILKMVEGLPVSLAGRIVGVRYRPEELPKCRIGIAFEGLTKEAGEAVRRYVQERCSHASESGESAPRDGTTTFAP